jgi:hypothetical protein
VKESGPILWLAYVASVFTSVIICRQAGLTLDKSPRSVLIPTHRRSDIHSPNLSCLIQRKRREEVGHTVSRDSRDRRTMQSGSLCPVGPPGQGYGPVPRGIPEDRILDSQAIELIKFDNCTDQRVPATSMSVFSLIFPEFAWLTHNISNNNLAPLRKSSPESCTITRQTCSAWDVCWSRGARCRKLSQACPSVLARYANFLSHLIHGR